MNNRFDYETFKKEFNDGDIWGLQYLETTIINDLKETNKNKTDITREDYIIDLFYATMALNSCNNIYEITDKAKDFDYNLYFDTRNLLFKELGFNLDDLYN